MGTIVYLLVFFVLWSDFKTHHILPSVPLLMISFGIAFSKYSNEWPSYAWIVLVIILLSTTLYVGVGLMKFTDDPRDEATNWLETEADTEAVMTVFGNSPPKAGLVHGQPIDHYQFGQTSEPGESYTEWILSTPDRNPRYIQTTPTIRNEDRFPRREKFNTRLIDGDHYGYVVAAEFGERPRVRSRQQTILYAGIEPNIEKRYKYVVILKLNQSNI
jgi:hypothetical protein